MARFMLGKRLGKARFLRLATLFCAASSFSIAAYGADGLSREDILRQHQQLERQHENPNGVSDDQGDAAMAPPLASPSSGLEAPSAHRTENGADAPGQSSESLTARLLQRVSNLEAQVRDMRGELDELKNQVQQSQADTAKQIGDMQFAQQNHRALRSSGADAAKISSGSMAAVDGGTPKPSMTPLKSGQDALKAKRYEDAEYYARAALKTAKSKSVKGAANFLLAQSMAGQKNYRQSAVSYFDAYRSDPTSSRASEALIGVAASMVSLKNKPAACEALNKLNDEFPNASARVKSSAKIFRARAACH